METTRLNFLEHVELIKTTYEPGTGPYAIAELILVNKNNDEFWNQKLSIFEMASLTHTSSSSITRFAQNLGLRGFKELLVVMRSKDHFPMKMHHNPKKSYDEDFLFKSSIVINEIYENIKLIRKVNDDLQMKKRIFFFGVKQNFLLIKLIIPILEQTGIKVYYSNDESQQEFYISKLTKHDLVVLISIDFDSQLFSHLYEIIRRYNLVSIIATRNWESKILETFKQRYILKLGYVKDGHYLDNASDFMMMFLLRILFTALLDLKIID